MRPLALLSAACAVNVVLVLFSTPGYADPNAPAAFTVTEEALRPADKVPPLGANNYGRIGAIEWAANNFVMNSGNEPIYWQNMHRAVRVGPGWFEIDGPGTSWWDLWGNGFLSGARVRIYRLVDENGGALPPAGDYLDVSQADHVEFVGESQVLPEGSPGFPEGGWVVATLGEVYPLNNVRFGNASAADYYAVENGTPYWYAVAAVGVDGAVSGYSNEASVTPEAVRTAGPALLITTNEPGAFRGIRPGSPYSYQPQAIGGAPPYAWRIEDAQGDPLALPGGLSIDGDTGLISGTLEESMSDFPLTLVVRDGEGAEARRKLVLNASEPTGPDGAPEPPSNLQATAGDGFVILSWDVSPSDNVAAYRVFRAEAPPEEREQRVYLDADAPDLEPFDYVALEKRWTDFDMSGVHPRVRGIGNPVDEPGWYYNGDQSVLDFGLAAHPEPVPAEMIDPGATCMRVEAQEGAHIINQYTFIGTEIEGENQWYGYLEPSEDYRAEVWLRQEGLGEGGEVAFSFSTLRRQAYPNLGASFDVTGEWQRFTYDFTAPAGAPPADIWHYGPALAFAGPGTLWVDNFRVYRYDSPAEREAYYSPNKTVLDELLASQPETGPKGAHRIWFLERDATMDHILSWHANAMVRPDWSTRVRGTLDMTLPMGLSFDLATGDRPESRMRPWLVLQHLCHDEQDWLNLIEYLAAPYDPETDAPADKPYAYMRYQQRGVTTPWTDEFAEILLEFGNETWHNGVFDNWLGFHLHHHVHQGGPEYGYFAQYLIGVIKTSPYWTSEDLEHKIRFVLGGNYDGARTDDGGVRGYVEEAMLNAPGADYGGHANYVGPKWETGDASQSAFNDHGVQETLIGFLTGVDERQREMGLTRDYLETQGVVYEIAAYEGGPSGYALPGSADPQQVETNERYGKSLAMAVAALDAWMRSYEYGWTYQAFLAYGQGSHWNSHTPFLEGFRPSPGWYALAMRNRHAAGDLMRVTVDRVPAYERQPGESYPLAGAYAMRDGTTWSVFLLSRKLDGQHDGYDFGDGSTPVTLELPFAEASSITLHRLTGDPRESNRHAHNIQPESLSLPASSLKNGAFEVDPATGGLEGGLPAGSIYIYVFEEDAGPADSDGDGLSDSDETRDLDPSTDGV